MRFPSGLYKALALSFIKKGLSGVKKSPLVLMLEPTLRCNLSCAGCDRIRLANTRETEDLPLHECVAAAVESRAPVVTVTGGEPLLYKDLKPLLSELLRLKRYVYLCSNGILCESFVEDFEPHPAFTLNIHLDGMEKSHDRITGRVGMYNKALEAIRRAKEKGFRVCTNTSVYKNSDVGELGQLFATLSGLNLDGILISPAFSYESVGSDIFMGREETRRLFREMGSLFDRYAFMSTPMYIEFLQGKREMSCTPWGNPTRNPLGWKSPCYLITDTYYRSFKDLMEGTDWDAYGTGHDPRCRDCMVHSGYEATVMRRAFSSPRDLARLLLWNLKRP
jgi:hopanoid biosynthesis associated radical SAM protein HpnH